ncbi:phage baseplate assembly protein [Bradyrhizobium valentinum]|uniref:Mu P family protein n=1 Tax=Bradyrhizobium valentinum TaxID=1518501 RepID=A0A0R3M0J6_9BRAD|nr:hypothetical protein [Bradyrhizobium valentinum]KRR11535.1 hypothetical protein CP49_18035 [Bradyrhizobium valentinum]
MARQDISETATLIVQGKEFKDFTSISLSQRYAEFNPVFAFDCTEFMPAPATAAKLAIKPGDVVQAYLAGQPALSGYVVERHVGYDARNHGVKIVGVGKSWDLTNCSVFEQGGAMDGMSITQIATKLASEVGVTVRTVGNVDNTPFENAHVQPAEMISSAIERYARHRCAILGSSPNGELLIIGAHPANPSGALIEGQNILRANCVIRDENTYKKIYAIGQRHSNDEVRGDAANKQIAMVTGSATRERKLVVMHDISDSDHGIKQRAEIEKLFTEGGKVEAHITVQGWLKADGKLWKAGEYYRVKSPMLLLDDVLGCKVASFDQGPAGTTTTLEMVLPDHLGGKPDMRGPTPT